MTKFSVKYQGHLSCELNYTATGHKLTTNGPKELGGTGETFSPTDLLAAGLVSCMITTIYIAAEKNQFTIDGTITAEVEKTMITEPVRRMGSVDVALTLPANIPEEKRAVVERAVHHCPAHHSLHPDVAIHVTFNYI